jgi:hypothetical protein
MCIDWEFHYAALLMYGGKFGHCNIPSTATFKCYISDDYEYKGKLGQWLSMQRKMKKGIAGVAVLSPRCESLLQALVDQGRY